MNPAELAIKNRLLSFIVIILTFWGGWVAYQGMSRFEDPEFIIRIAQINTPYPGASPEEVAREVTDTIEKSLQQLQEVDVITSTSKPGMSEVQVEIKYKFSKTKSDLQLVWNKVRNKIADAQRSLPPNAQTSIVNDDFADVYGYYYFITGEGYSSAELRAYAKEIQSELLLVEGVGKVAFAGDQKEAIYVEISKENSTKLGVNINQVYQILQKQNTVLPAGDVKIGNNRVVIDPTDSINSVDSIKKLLVSTGDDGKLIYLEDIAKVWRGYQTPPQAVYRYNGKEAIALGVASIQGENVVKVGNALQEKLEESTSRRPIGIELHEFYHQGKIVDDSVQNFVVNVIAALVIVIITLLIFMGIRSALVIGLILLLTVSATLLTMDLSGIPMHRISLGALIIALGMMVDNAIVVTEGILVGVQRGVKKLEIAKSIVSQTKWPLLGGTLVGIIAFAPIGFAPGDTAEYTGHLFWVVLISLMFSWVFALTITPFFCHLLFKEADNDSQNLNQKESKFSTLFKDLIRLALKFRWPVVGVTIGLFISALWGFQFVKNGFFPVSTTPQIIVDYNLPEGTDLDITKSDAIEIEKYLQTLQGVEAVQTLIGKGGLRYMLVYVPESPSTSYAQLLVKVQDYKMIDGLIPKIQKHIDASFPNAQAKVWRFVLGPGGGSKIEATFKGPDPVILKQLAEKAKAIMVEDGRTLSIKDDWRQAVNVIEPQYSEIKGQRAGISREDLANALQKNFSGQSIGVYREGNDLIPIIARAPEGERKSIDNIKDIQVQSSISGAFVPIEQVTDGFITKWKSGIYKRENRIWTINAQCDPYPDELASDLLARLMPKIEAIELPDGYTLEWGGEYGDSKESNDDLATTLPMGFGAMVLVVIVLFGSLRQPIIIWLIVPLAIIGVVIGLVSTGKPMEFMGILGLLSLSGLLIKNAIVLVDQIDLEIKENKPRFDAIVDSTSSRVRPVMMGSLTTVLGVIPLFFDAFFQSMSVVLVFGLSFATLLTLIVLPTLYAIFFNVSSKETSNAKN